jgi:hypothetical protein
VRGLEVVLLQINVGNYVVITVGVLFGTEVPWLLLGIVFTLFESLKFVIEVQDVVGLLVSECAVLVLGQGVDHALLLGLLDSLLLVLLFVDLGDGVVDGVILLDKLISDFYVLGSSALEVALFVNLVV